MKNYPTLGAAAGAFKAFSARAFPQHRPVKPYPSNIKAMYRGLFMVRDAAVGHIGQTGIGRAIWGSQTLAARKGKASNLPTFVHPMTITGTGEQYQAGLQLTGIPAMIERGGRTKPHAIYPSGSGKFTQSRRLSFRTLASNRVRRGRNTFVGDGALKLVNGRYVRHVKRHTATIPKRPIVGPLLTRAESLFRGLIERGFKAEADRGIG